MEEKFKRETLEKYLKAIKVETNLENTILINHHDLEGNFYCINKQYIRLHYTKGIPEYLYEQRKEEVNKFFKQKTPRTLQKEELKKLIEEEIELVKHLKIPTIPKEIIENVKKEKPSIIKEEIIYKRTLRINAGHKNILLTTTPSIIITRNQQIKGIIDIKTVKTKEQAKETNYLDIQKTLVNLMAIEKRKIPKIKNPILITVKTVTTEQYKEKYKIAGILEKIKNIGQKTTIKTLIHNRYNAILIKKTNKEKIIERLEALTKEEIPLKTCPYKNIKCNFRNFCKKLEIDA